VDEGVVASCIFQDFSFSTIHIFEPLPDNQKLISENILKYKAKI
jgi:hypothetical protein